jgi:hypothetical protein
MNVNSHNSHARIARPVVPHAECLKICSGTYINHAVGAETH